MIPEKTKALFQFINFLHSNIDNFKQYESVVQQLEILDAQRSSLKRQNNYKEKLEYDEVKLQIEQKFAVINKNIIEPLHSKATELQIGYLDNRQYWNWSETGFYDLKENFEKLDIPEILQSKNKYIEYRKLINTDYFQTFFFRDLDKNLKELFEFFSDSDKNEFEAFEVKTIQVNSIEEAVKHFTKRKDERFWLNDFFDKKQFTMPEYLAYKSQIDNNGSFVIKLDNDSVNIYTSELAIILTSKLNARNMETQTTTVVNGRDYLDTYIEAYKEGEQYFENEFKVTANTLYGLNAEQYVRDIHLNFFHINHSGAHEGWSYVKKNFPLVVTYKVIKDFGYYSGIVSKVEAMVKKYPKQFQTFDICEHQNQPQQIETIKPKKPKKTLLEFIQNIENKETFIQELKILFPTEQGKSIKAIVLKLVEVQILIYGTKEFFQFYNELKAYFNRDIGTYQSINDVKIVDKETTNTINLKLNPLIAKYKAN